MKITINNPALLDYLFPALSTPISKNQEKNVPHWCDPFGFVGGTIQPPSHHYAEHEARLCAWEYSQNPRYAVISIKH